VTFDVICISRADGAGGEDVGREVASRLGFRYIDEEVIDRAAERGGIDASLGLPMAWLSRRLGHGSVVITDTIYGHIESAARKEIAKGLDGAFLR
jgi:integrase